MREHKNVCVLIHPNIEELKVFLPSTMNEKTNEQGQKQWQKDPDGEKHGNRQDDEKWEYGRWTNKIKMRSNNNPVCNSTLNECLKIWHSV